MIGSLASSLYTAKMHSATAVLPAGAAHTATDSVGGAAAAAHGAFTDDRASSHGRTSPVRRRSIGSRWS